MDKKNKLFRIDFMCLFFILIFFISCGKPEKTNDNNGTQASITADWPNWRGPEWTGISNEKNWDPKKLKTENIVWENDLGRAYSSPVIANGRVYVQGMPEKNEILYCLNFKDGTILWQRQFTEIIGGATIPQSTPTVDDGLVYILSPHATVHCLDAYTGDVVWEKRLMWDLHVTLPRWNFSGSVRIIGQTAIVNAGFGIALNKKTGEIIWANATGMAGYSTPVIFYDNDLPRIAIGALDDLNILDFDSGKILMTFPWKHVFQQDTPADPLVFEDKILLSSVIQRGAILLKMSDKGFKTVWNKREISNLSSFVYIDGLLYGNSNPTYGESSANFDAAFFCMDPKTGTIKWTKDTGLGTVIAVGDYLIHQFQNGMLEIGKIDANDFVPISQMKVLKGSTYNHPAFSQGYLITRNERGHILCIDLN